MKLNIFYCSNSCSIDDLTSVLREEKGDEYKIISLPCSGKANLLYFLKAFETGADGMVLITCAKDQCRYLVGNMRAPKRAGQVSLILEEIGMGDGRIKVLQADGKGMEHIAREVAGFSDTIKKMSPNAIGGADDTLLVNAS